jgi:hypothetical protein
MSKPMTITARRKELRHIREALNMAIFYMEPGATRDMTRSDQMISYAGLRLNLLCGTLANERERAPLPPKIRKTHE